MTDRKMKIVPFCVSMTNFEVNGIPDVVLFVAICTLLEAKTSLNISNTKFRLKAFAVDKVYSCYFSIELFRKSSDSCVVDISFINGSRELFFEVFKLVKCAILFKEHFEIKKKTAQKSFAVWRVSCGQMLEKHMFSDIELQACENFANYFHIEHLLELNTEELNCFKLSMIKLLESNKVDFIRYACIVLKAILKRSCAFLQKDILIWKSMLCMHYQQLPSDSIFSRDILHRIAKVVCLE